MSQQWPGTPVSAAPAQPRSAPQPIVAAGPRPGEVADDARADAGLANDNIKTGIAVRSEDRAILGEQIGNDAKLKAQYEGLQPIKDYRAVVPIMMDALDAPPDATGDNALIYAYAKVMDPGSVVRESEMGMAASGASAIEATVANLKKQFGIEGGGQLPPDVRRKLKFQINNRAYQMRLGYLNQRQRFATDAQAYGLDPARVIGPDDMAPYVERYYESAKREFGAQAPLGPDGKPVAPNAPPGNVQQGGPGAPQTGEDGGLTGEVSYDPAEWDARGNYIGPASPAPGQVDSRPESFMQGVREGIYDAGANAANFMENTLGLRNLRELAVAAGMDLPAMPSDQAKAWIDDQAQRGPYKASTAGEITGDIIGALPAVAARNPALSGALGGFLVTDNPNDLQGTAVDVGVGAGLGYGVGKVGDKVGDFFAARRAAKAANPTPTPAQNYASAQNFGIELSPADAGGRGAKVTERLLDAQPASADALNVARMGKTDQMATAAGNVADTFGQEASFRSMGVTAQKGAQGWIDRFDKVTEKAYQAIPIPGEKPATVENTRTALRGLTDIFRSNPQMRQLMQNGRLTAFLDALTPGETAAAKQAAVQATETKLTQAQQQLNALAGQRSLSGLRMPDLPEGEILAARKSVAKAEQEYNAAIQNAQAPAKEGSLSWEDLKSFRSIVGEQIGEALFSDGTRKSQLRALYGALSEDMKTSAAQQGPAALRAFERANNLYREGQTRIDDVLTQFLGNDAKNNPEAAAALIQRIAKEGKAGSDIATLAELRKSLKPDEWGQVSNGLIRLLGAPANQEGRGFAAETFMRNFAGMADESKNLLFGKGPLRDNLDEFARVIGLVGKNDATRNVSGTAMATSGITSSGLFGGLGAAVGGIPGALLGIAANHATAYGAGKLWTNPGFVRWMTGFTKMAKTAAANGGQISQKAFDNQMGALGRVASSQSVIAADALGLQRQLIEQFSSLSAGTPQRLAAEPVSASDEETPTTAGAQR